MDLEREYLWSKAQVLQSRLFTARFIYFYFFCSWIKPLQLVLCRLCCLRFLSNIWNKLLASVCRCKSSVDIYHRFPWFSNCCMIPFFSSIKCKRVPHCNEDFWEMNSKSWIKIWFKDLKFRFEVHLKKQLTRGDHAWVVILVIGPLI